MTGHNSGVVTIRGREYTTVARRVQDFREAHPDWTLTTEIVHRDADCVVMRAVIIDEAGRVRANGHAEEYRKASEINRTSDGLRMIDISNRTSSLEKIECAEFLDWLLAFEAQHCNTGRQ